MFWASEKQIEKREGKREVCNDTPISPALLHAFMHLHGRTGTHIPPPNTGTKHTPTLQVHNAFSISAFLVSPFLFYPVSEVPVHKGQTIF